jgi:retron-type reverse transcriptase
MELLEKHFQMGNLRQIYFEHVRFRAGRGTDGVGRERFEKDLDKTIAEAADAILAGRFSFRPYRASLLPRGRARYPRVVESPCIVDKVVLRGLHDLLKEVFDQKLSRRTLHSQVKSVINEFKLGRNDTAVRLDIRDFYPTIRHETLVETLRSTMPDDTVVDLVYRAVTTPSSIDRSEKIAKRTIGVPQGLAVSGILANLYLFPVDETYESIAGLGYHRYMDDFLILTEQKQADGWKSQIQTDLSRLGLQTSTEKTQTVRMGDSFQYLGYAFEKGTVTVRPPSVQKIYTALSSIFAAQEHASNPNPDQMAFRLSTRITGCIFEGKKYGWLFFFSQITDERLLHRLDQFVTRKLRRFGLSRKEVPRFVRAYFEINHREPPRLSRRHKLLRGWCQYGTNETVSERV